MIFNLQSVSTGYEKNKDVLHDVEVALEGGGVWGILGPNGIGKTTLLRVLAGTMPYRGSLTLDERELSDSPRRELARRVSLLPQFSSVYFSYTVYDTVLLGRYARQGNSIKDRLGGPGPEDREAVSRVLKETGTADLAGRMLGELSGGQLQRVLLARTMAQETPIILLDEPTNHLDLRYRQSILQELQAWSKKTTNVDGVDHPNTVIAVFHDIGSAAMIADRVLLISREDDSGRITIEKGSAKEMLTRSRLHTVYGTDVIQYYEDIYRQLTKDRS